MGPCKFLKLMSTIQHLRASKRISEAARAGPESCRGFPSRMIAPRLARTSGACNCTTNLGQVWSSRFVYRDPSGFPKWIFGVQRLVDVLISFKFRFHKIDHRTHFWRKQSNMGFRKAPELSCCVQRSDMSCGIYFWGAEAPGRKWTKAEPWKFQFPKTISRKGLVRKMLSREVHFW